MSDSEAKERLDQVSERISIAAQKSGRDPRTVTLVAVSKTKPWEAIEAFYRLGVRNFGENYVQEAQEKFGAAKNAGCDDIQWHLIGTLQSNKAKFVPGNFCLFHALDSETLGTKIHRAALARQVVQDCLLEVNVDLEHTKGGVGEALAATILESLGNLSNIRIKGLMCIPEPAPTRDPRVPFARLRNLLEKLTASGAYPGRLTELSMGMSADFEAAIEEGATIVRVGTTLFGSRERR